MFDFWEKEDTIKTVIIAAVSAAAAVITVLCLT
jgi:hypothetical protein